VALELARQARLALHKALDELGEVEGREAQAVQHGGELRGLGVRVRGREWQGVAGSGREWQGVAGSGREGRL
jgi:hypothetical protein